MVDTSTSPVVPPVDRAWDSHGDLVRRWRASRGGQSESAAYFAENDYLIGRLPEELARRAADVFAAADTAEFRRRDTLAEFRANVHITNEDQYGQENKHLRLGPDECRVLREIVRQLRPQIADCVGSPWRVVTVRSFRTVPPVHGGAPTPQEWHYDGFPADVLKVMLYLSDVGGELGTTELVSRDGTSKVVEGPFGTWLLFRNSVLAHRAVQPAKGQRTVVEITFAPAFTFTDRITVAGTNAQYQYHSYSMYWPVNWFARWRRRIGNWARLSRPGLADRSVPYSGFMHRRSGDAGSLKIPTAARCWTARMIA